MHHTVVPAPPPLVAGENGFENFLLARAKFGKAEHPFQRLFCLVYLDVHGISMLRDLWPDCRSETAAKPSRKGYGIAASSRARTIHKNVPAMRATISSFNLVASASVS